MSNVTKFPEQKTPYICPVCETHYLTSFTDGEVWCLACEVQVGGLCVVQFEEDEDELVVFTADFNGEPIELNFE